MKSNTNETRNTIPKLRNDWANAGSSFPTSSTSLNPQSNNHTIFNKDKGASKDGNYELFSDSSNSIDNSFLSKSDNILQAKGMQQMILYTKAKDEKARKREKNTDKNRMKKHRKRKHRKSRKKKREENDELTDDKHRKNRDEKDRHRRFRKREKNSKKKSRRNESPKYSESSSSSNESARSDSRKYRKRESTFNDIILSKDFNTNFQQSETTENKNPILIPKTKMRTLTSVTGKSIRNQNNRQDKLLLTMDESQNCQNKSDPHESKQNPSSKKEPIDFLRGFEKYLKENHLPYPRGYNNNSLNLRSLLQRQRELNQITQNDPKNIDAWLELASLSHHSKMIEANIDSTSTNHTAIAVAQKKDFERKKDILIAAKQYNLDNIDIRYELIHCRMDLEEDHEYVQEEFYEAINYIHGIANSWKVSNDGIFNTSSLHEAQFKPKSNDRGRGVDNAPAWMTQGKKLQNTLHTHKNHNRQNYMTQVSKYARSLLRLHRLYLRYLRQSPSLFTAEKIRISYRDAFKSLYSIYACTQNHKVDNSIASEDYHSIGAESSILLLDYLRLESQMGYSERAIGILQSVLELNLSIPNLNTNHRYDKDQSKEWQHNWRNSFQCFWDSEAPRIGDSFPDAGWMTWESRKFTNSEDIDASVDEKGNECEYTRRKKKTRLKASDFFSKVHNANKRDEIEITGSKLEAAKKINLFKGKSFQRKSNISQAYKMANSLTKPLHSPVKSTSENAFESRLLSQSINIANKYVLEVESESSSSPHVSQIVSKEQNVDFHTKTLKNKESSSSTDATVSNLIVQGQGGFILSKLGKDEKVKDSNTLKFYSFVHKRTIDITRKEMTNEYVKDSLQRALRNLKNKGKNDTFEKKSKGQESSNILESRVKLLPVSDDDPFFVWGGNEYAHINTHKSLYSLPFRSLTSSEYVEEDPNSAVLYEDGINDMILPYLSNFDAHQDLASVVRVSLEFLGVFFPRSATLDIFCQNLNSVEQSSYGLQEIFDKFKGDSEKNWANVLFQIHRNDNLICFNPSLFEAGNKKQLDFVRRVLYGLILSFEMLSNNCIWYNFITCALILLEAHAHSPDIERIESLTKAILSNTDAAKEDPKLWIAFSNVFFVGCEVLSSKTFNKPLKYLLSTLEATQGSEFHGKYAQWWLEASLTAVRWIIGLYHCEDVDIILPLISHEARERVLFVLCSAIEGKFLRSNNRKVSIESSKSSSISSMKLTKAKDELESMIMKSLNDFESTETIRKGSSFFDPTPKAYYYVMIRAWLELVAATSVNNTVRFAAGIHIIEHWMKIIATSKECKTVSARICLSRLANSMLELTILSQKNNPISSENVLQNILIPTSALLEQCGCKPSQPFLFAICVAESKVGKPLLMNGYGALLAGLRTDCNLSQAYYMFSKLICKVKVELRAEELFDFATLLPEFSLRKIQKAIQDIFNLARHCSIPSLWSALIRLELIQGILITRDTKESQIRTGNSFLAGRKYYEQGLAKCMYSKDLWLESFRLLRPVFSKQELMMQMTTLDEIDLRLLKELDEYET